jgi:hypothetical protein
MWGWGIDRKGKQTGRKKKKKKEEWVGTDKVGPLNDNFFSTLLGHVIRVIGKFFSRLNWTRLHNHQRGMGNGQLATLQSEGRGYDGSSSNFFFLG